MDWTGRFFRSEGAKDDTEELLFGACDFSDSFLTLLEHALLSAGRSWWWIHHHLRHHKHWHHKCFLTAQPLPSDRCPCVYSTSQPVGGRIDTGYAYQRSADHRQPLGCARGG